MKSASGVATVEHGWARAHPTSARVDREICTHSKSFWRSRESGGGSRLYMNLKVHRISSKNTSRKCVCPLQIVHAYLASGGPWTPLGDFFPADLLCPPYLQTLAMPLKSACSAENRRAVCYVTMRYAASLGLFNMELADLRRVYTTVQPVTVCKVFQHIYSPVN